MTNTALAMYESSVRRLNDAQKASVLQSAQIIDKFKEKEKAARDAARALDQVSQSGGILNNTLRSMASAAAAYISLNFAKENPNSGWLGHGSKQISIGFRDNESSESCSRRFVSIRTSFTFTVRINDSVV